jgi:HAD superfamily hydrolase (TIGR01509 family)
MDKESSIKAIIFDLDGVLINSKHIHYETFCKSVKKVSEITLTWDQHTLLYDGLSTRQKLQKMTDATLITNEQADKIFFLKQNFTEQQIRETVKPRPYLIYLLQTLKAKGYTLACASNCIRPTVILFLEMLNIIDFFSIILSNNDVFTPKPSPEIYLKCFQQLNRFPSECLICEDSHYGRQAARASGAHLLEVEDAEDVTLEKILSFLQKNDIVKRQRINVVIPMAGEGRRFREKGYNEPKPFIPVFGKPMIQWVIENMNSKSEFFELFFIFLARKEHVAENSLEQLLTSLNIQFTIITVDKLTEGAACTVLLAEKHISTDDPMVIVNADQYVEWDNSIFYKCLLNNKYCGLILSFYSPDEQDTKWSFAKLDENLFVSRVAEKEWISPNATVGIYGWRHGTEFVKYAKQMISKNIRVNNEYYICPIYNEAIQDYRHIRTIECKKMWGLGVPSDLENFLQNYKQI